MAIKKNNNINKLRGCGPSLLYSIRGRKSITRCFDCNFYERCLNIACCNSSVVSFTCENCIKGKNGESISVEGLETSF